MEKFSLDLAVRKVARRKGVRMVEIARRIDRCMRTVQKTLKHNAPTIATAERYAEALGVTLQELIVEGYVH